MPPCWRISTGRPSCSSACSPHLARLALLHCAAILPVARAARAAARRRQLRRQDRLLQCVSRGTRSRGSTAQRCAGTRLWLLRLVRVSVDQPARRGARRLLGLHRRRPRRVPARRRLHRRCRRQARARRRAAGGAHRAPSSRRHRAYRARRHRAAAAALARRRHRDAGARATKAARRRRSHRPRPARRAGDRSRPHRRRALRRRLHAQLRRCWAGRWPRQSPRDSSACWSRTAS